MFCLELNVLLLSVHGHVYMDVYILIYEVWLAMLGNVSSSLLFICVSCFRYVGLERESFSGGAPVRSRPRLIGCNWRLIRRGRDSKTRNFI